MTPPLTADSGPKTSCGHCTTRCKAWPVSRARSARTAAFVQVRVRTLFMVLRYYATLSRWVRTIATARASPSWASPEERRRMPRKFVQIAGRIRDEMMPEVRSSSFPSPPGFAETPWYARVAVFFLPAALECDDFTTGSSDMRVNAMTRTSGALPVCCHCKRWRGYV